jgi:hypothetical protein
MATSTSLLPLIGAIWSLHGYQSLVLPMVCASLLRRTGAAGGALGSVVVRHPMNVRRRFLTGCLDASIFCNTRTASQAPRAARAAPRAAPVPAPLSPRAGKLAYPLSRWYSALFLPGLGDQSEVPFWPQEWDEIKRRRQQTQQCQRGRR